MLLEIFGASAIIFSITAVLLTYQKRLEVDDLQIQMRVFEKELILLLNEVERLKLFCRACNDNLDDAE